ncbi:MAG TPA: hypothetical protein VGB75_12675 [Jatrophihabitans sp.]|uniref:hypothetical protein n=1 Tax=Jatrophihabitans sp. TaxID=1932789 RepID=UPI002EF8D77E
MLLAVVLIGLLALPYVLSAVIALVRRQCERIAEQRQPAVPPTAPIEKVTADLRRLRAQLEARENGPGLTGKGMRMGAVRTAYVQVLGVACQQLDVPPPRSEPHWHTPLAEIYRVEAQLRERGLDVRPVSMAGSHAA